MSTKLFLKIGVAFGLLAMLLVFLGVNYIPRSSARSSASENAVQAAKYAKSDYFERHPSLAAKPENFAGSDWIERHPSAVAKPVNYAGSDWIERHPSSSEDLIPFLRH